MISCSLISSCWCLIMTDSMICLSSGVRWDRSGPSAILLQESSGCCRSVSNMPGNNSMGRWPHALGPAQCYMIATTIVHCLGLPPSILVDGVRQRYTAAIGQHFFVHHPDIPPTTPHRPIENYSFTPGCRGNNVGAQ